MQLMTHHGITQACLERRFIPDKYTKCRVNDDPGDIEKWSIIDPSEHEMS